MKANIQKLILEYQKFMDDILDDDDSYVFHDIVSNRYEYHPKTKDELIQNIEECL